MRKDQLNKKHFSHPHALKLSESLPKENDEEATICSGCEQPLQPDTTTVFYTCPQRDCDFILHKSCFELPKKTDHQSHPNHPLALLSEPPSYSLYYNCTACGDLINSFAYQCENCADFRLHVKCTFLPDSVECKGHNKHPLIARYDTPKTNKKGYMTCCDVCDGIITEGYWSYYCQDCDFVTHLECAISAIAEKEEEAEEEVEEEEEEEEEENGENEDEDEEELSDAMKLMRANIRAMDQMNKLNFQMQMARLNASTVAHIWY